jgi:hypothetical protein
MWGKCWIQNNTDCGMGAEGRGQVTVLGLAGSAATGSYNLCCSTGQDDISLPLGALTIADSCPKDREDYGEIKIAHPRDPIMAAISARLCQVGDSKTGALNPGDVLFGHCGVEKDTGSWSKVGEGGFLVSALDSDRWRIPMIPVSRQWSSCKNVSSIDRCKWNGPDADVEKCFAEGKLSGSEECDRKVSEWCAGDGKGSSRCVCFSTKLRYVGSPACLDGRCIKDGWKTAEMMRQMSIAGGCDGACRRLADSRFANCKHSACVASDSRLGGEITWALPALGVSALLLYIWMATAR